MQALKELSAPQVTALREGNWVKIPSREVVVGDLLKFSSGDRIGADVRLITVNSLEIEESALTGNQFRSRNQPVFYPERIWELAIWKIWHSWERW